MEQVKTIARNISLIENKSNGFEEILLHLQVKKTSGIIGITGSPGAGKSTMVDALIQTIINDNKTVAVLCIDPSSAFNMGALLGDRIRMSRWYNNDNVFIRSLASRKALGGLSPMIIEVTEYLKTTGFDYIIIETVGVGQNEIDIAGLADVTVVTLVPENGDEIQTMKSGIMEVADVFVVNKCDRPEADLFVKHLRSMLAPAFGKTSTNIPVIKAIASQHIGVDELYISINNFLKTEYKQQKQGLLLAERAYQLIQQHRMRDVDKTVLHNNIEKERNKLNNFNLYRFVKQYY